VVDISFVAMLLSYMPCPFQLSCINRNIYVITADRGTWMSFGCHSYTPQDQWRRSVESRQQSEMLSHAVRSTGRATRHTRQRVVREPRREQSSSKQLIRHCTSSRHLARRQSKTLYL